MTKPDQWRPARGEVLAQVLRRFQAWCGGLAQANTDEGCLLVAAALDPGEGSDPVGAVVVEGLARLDALAASVPEPTLASLSHHLFANEHFAGNHSSYYDPANSLLHHVLRRRVGIPITLSVVAMEVGRRCGVLLHGVGLPGHFLLGAVDPERFIDPFAGGRMLDGAGARRLVSDALGPEQPVNDAWLARVDQFAIVARVLANLKQIYRSQGQRTALATVLALRVLVPGVPPSERRELSDALAAVGRFGEAADVLDGLALEVGGASRADELAVRSRRLRARLN